MPAQARAVDFPMLRDSALVCRGKVFIQQRWHEQHTPDIYESCTFKQVDFSRLTLGSDYIFCKFIDCDFTDVELHNIGFVGRFPILNCQFINCLHVPVTPAFQETLKGCRVEYEPWMVPRAR